MASVKELRSFRSAPTQNALGLVLVTSTTHTPGSAESSAQAAARSRASCVDTAFIASGRSSASSAMWPPWPCRVTLTIGRMGVLCSVIDPASHDDSH